MEILYFKTSDYELDEILDYCVECYENNGLDVDDIFEWKELIIQNYPHTNIFIMNERCEIVAIDDQNIRTKSGDTIWTVIDIEYLEIEDVEYFDLDKYNHIVDYGFRVIEAGYNIEHNWVYLKAESKTTYHRSFLFNLQNIHNLVGYIRKKKINLLLNRNQKYTD